MKKASMNNQRRRSTTASFGQSEASMNRNRIMKKKLTDLIGNVLRELSKR